MKHDIKNRAAMIYLLQRGLIFLKSVIHY